MKKFHVYVVHFTALVLFVIYCGAAGYTGIITYKPVVRRISHYHFWESWINPRGLDEQLGNYVLYALPLRDTLIRNIHAYLTLIQNKKESRNFTLIKDDFGYFHRGNLYQIVDLDSLYYARRLRSVNNDHLGRNRNSERYFLALGGADRLNTSPLPIYPGYPVNYTGGIELDSILIKLSEYDVETMDLRHFFKNSRLQYEDVFYRTERGWTAIAAFEAASGIVNKINEKRRPELDISNFFRNSENYQRYQYHDAFQGAFSRSAGLPFGGAEDFIVLLPSFETSFSIFGSLHSTNPLKEGTFSEILINFDYINSNSRNMNPELIYSYRNNEDYHFRRIVNNLNPTGPKMVFVGGNDFLTTVYYLSLRTSETIFLSVNHPNFQDLLDLFVDDDEGYDIFIFGMEVDSINDDLFPFHTGY